MLKQSLLRTIFISGIILLINVNAKAGIQSYLAAPLDYTTPAVAGSSTTVQVPSPYTDPSFVDYSVTDKITLSVNHSHLAYMPTPGDVVVTLKVDKWNVLGIMTTSYPVLTLKYQPFNPAFPYNDKSVYKFNDAYKMTVTIQSITVAGVTSLALPANLRIDADILLERYTNFATATSPIAISAPTVNDLDCDGVNDEIQINWATTVGVEEYEFEWTFVNDYGPTVGGTYIVPSALNYDFKHNSTRITTTYPYYTISLIFEHGYLLYRVRGIGRDINNPTKRVVGYWSVLADNGLVSTVSSKYFNTQEHEANKNWQYSTTFAEEGKKKEVISYFDGSLRNRQSVTKVNTDNNTIVGETIYDHQGRPAINVLPVPVTNPVCGETSIKFYPQFNKVNSTTGYSRADFDVDVSTSDTCNPFIKGMDVSSGASNYYSASNPNKVGSQAFVPDAELYPFSQIEYTPDNTGRIRRQGGVGKEFQLDKNHATKYYYGWPQQPQLDRLFGSEVGDAAHYKKNLVVDANGQVSISYLDQEGRTIATSLAGDAPKDATGTVTVLEALPSMPASQPLVVDMFAEDANGKSSVNVVNVQEDGIEFVSQLLVAYQSDYEFTYDIAIDKMTDPCLKSTVCINCVYDLEIKIVDDCGRVLAPITGINPNIKNIGRFTTDVSGALTGFNLDCTIPSLYTKSEGVKVNLPIGNYTVIKKLTVNKAAKDFYVASYLERTFTPTEAYVNLNPGCVNTYQSFLDAELANLDTADCNISCSVCAASLKNGYATFQEARDAWVAAGNGTELDFDYLLQECNAPCRETSVCETNYEMMLMDVSPDGQYAEFQPKANGDAPDMTLSVFNTGNLLPQTTLTGGAYGHWRKPKIKISGTEYNVYIDDHGIRTQIPVSLVGALGAPGTSYTPTVVSSSQVYYDAPTDSYYTYPENLANLSDFVANWTDNWAKSLVMYHPEYSYYESCLDYNTQYTGALTSDTFDSLLVRTTSYADAVSRGLVVSSSSSPLAADLMILFDKTGSAIRDPFLFNASFTIYSGFLLSKMSTYRPSTSMAATAAIAARCGTAYGTLPVAATCDDFGSTVSTSTEILDLEWNIFKNLYLAEKQKLQKERDEVYARTNNGFNECIGNSSYNPFSCGMGWIGGSFGSSPFFAAIQPCGYNRYFYYKNKKKRFNPQTNTTAPSENETDYQAFLQTGQYPLAMDIQFLLNRLADDTKLASTTAVDLQLYPEFTQDLYVACGGVLSNPFSPFSWTATSTGSPTLTATITRAALTTTFQLTKPTSIANWNDIVGISDLKYTTSAGSVYSFSAVAAIANPGGGTTDPFIYIPITGSVTLNIGPGSYTFTEQCKPNDLATDLSILWSALAANSELSLATTVVLNASLTKYQAFITPAIKNALGTTSNNLHWKYTGGFTYELTDAAVPTKKLTITFTAGTAGLASARSFIDIKNNGAIGIHGFDVTGLDVTGAPLPLMSGNVTLVTGTSTPVPMGECGLPDPAICEGDEYQLREDLEELLNGVMLQQPFNYNPDLAANPLYTSLLQSYVGTSSQVSTTKYDYYTLNAANDYKEQILFNILCKCHLTLWHKGVSSNIIKFEDLTALGPLTPYGPVASDNSQYKFYLYATYLTGGSTISHDTIFGESCFPLKICNSIPSYDTVLSPEVPYVNPCILYAINIAHVNAENQYNQYIDSITTYIADKYNTHCLSALENFSAAYNDKEYHFTLYYYDQAGNLVKTIPPEGVQLVTIPADFVTIKNDRTFNRHDFFTTHQMATTYQYNSLNQLVRQAMPDHDMMPIWEFSLPNGLDSRLKVTGTQFVNSTKGYLSGYIDFTTPTAFKRGYLYTTDDGGTTWKKMNDMVAADIKKVQMISSSLTGYAVANYGIVLKTIDGGNTWDLFPTPSTSTLNDLYFTTDLAGVVVGDNNTVYKTINGGTSWTAVTSGLAASINVTGVTFDGVYYYITANTATLEGKIYRSPTALTSWAASAAIQTSNVLKVQLFPTTTEGYAIGTDGNLLKTTTSGTTWQTIAAGITTGFKDIYFKTPVSGTALEGVAIIDSVPGYGLLWKTIDGGATWNLLSAHDGTYYEAFHFYQNDKGYAVGNKKMKRIVMTGGIGLVNIPLPSSFTSSFTSVYFSDANNGWIGNTTQAFFINNATAASPTWSTPILHGSVTPIKKMFFSTANNSGLALSTGGKMYKITPSSSTYVFTSVSTTENYVDMDDNATRVYAFNKAVTSLSLRYIDKTTIAGASTLSNITGSLALAASVTCMDVHPTATTIYIGGSGSLLNRGTVTGTSVAWTLTYSSAVKPTALYGIRASGSGASTAHVYAVGKDGTLLQTVNSGTLWKSIQTGMTTQFNSIRFNKTEISPVAACTAIIAGNNGLLVKGDISSAGAITSSAIIPLTISNDLNDVAISTIPPYKAYAVGTAGTMVYIPTIVTPVPQLSVPKPSQTFNGVYFKHNATAITNEAYAVGTNASVYYYNGTSGAKINSVYTPGLNDVSFIDPLNGYTVGEKNTIRYTNNGGVTWQYVLRPTSALLMNAVATYAPGKAIIVGTGGYKADVVNTTVTNSLLGSAIFYDIAVNGTYGYMVGVNAAYKGTYAGSSWTWTSIPPPASTTLRAVHIFRNGTAIVAGNAGKVYCYNSSSAWVAHSTGIPTTAALKDVFFHDDRNGYVVGDAGVIYKYSTPNNVFSYTSTPPLAVLWTASVLTGTNGVPTPSDVNVVTIDFPTRNKGFLGGNFTTGTPINYARLVNDESGLYSTRFWYDRLGRMVVSQNTKQYNSTPSLAKYSYTLYDNLGRISEVGEKIENTAGAGVVLFSGIFGEYVNGQWNSNVINDANLLAWVSGTGSTSTRKEVTKTYYDNVIPGSTFGFTQSNLRKRVSSVSYEDVDDNNPLTYQSASHYSYDIHGNVKSLWQENKDITVGGQTLKRIDYEYDLISGKVNLVRFQDGQPDAFYHFYEYDSDNRIVAVYTSAYPQAGAVINSRTVLDNSLWTREAYYLYYAHGPLARVETGEAFNQLQGTDYAYTLQGWIKGVNSNLLKANLDMGGDGIATGHPTTPKDAFGYSLNYYQGDYAAIDATKWATANRFEATTAGSDMMAARYDLYNGNISAMVTSITEPKVYTSAPNEFPNILPQATSYKYDQLNRIKSMQAYTNVNTSTNTWQNGSTYAGRYNNTFTYDANGNILTQLRKDAAGTTFDNLTYNYFTEGGYKKQNRLYMVDDAVASGYTDDIDDQGTFNNTLAAVNTANNYSYDGIGNLVKDTQEEILRIEWTVYGKIKKIIRTAASTKDDLEFKYDASGNRIAKIVKPHGSSVENGGSDFPVVWKTTYYTRDAQGNIMSTYKYSITLFGVSSFKVIERNMFGSSRLGTENTQIELVSPLPLANPYVRTLGLKYYEQSNHLGNVLAVFTDKKIPRDDNSDGTIDYFQPEIISSNDYTPFGAQMDSRTFNSTSYRYGMNGKEKDDEIVGSGNSYDFGARMYSPRLGKFLSIDPLTMKYPWLTPYQYASNTPIQGIDIDGLEVYYAADGSLIGKIGDNTKVRVVNAENVEKVTFYVAWANNPDLPKTHDYATKRADQFSTDAGMSNEELNTRVMLTLIKNHEGGKGSEAYNTWYGGDKFESTDDHPGANSDGNSAAGAYQILKGSWNDEAYGKKIRTKYGIKDFSAKSQDKFTVGTIKDKRKALDLVKAGDFKGAIAKLKKEWVSLPGGSQSNTSQSKADAEIKDARANELKGNSEIATPKGELLDGF